MRNSRTGSDLSHNEATIEQSDIERAAVIVRAHLLCGDIGDFGGLPTSAIRAIVCARFNIDLRDRSADWIHGAFDTLVEQQAPLPRHDATPTRH